MTTLHQKKIKLSVANRRTKWAPFWVVMKKFGTGRRVHPSSITKGRRHWRKNKYGGGKLKIKPRRMRKQQLG